VSDYINPIICPVLEEVPIPNLKGPPLKFDFATMSIMDIMDIMEQRRARKDERRARKEHKKALLERAQIQADGPVLPDPKELEHLVRTCRTDSGYEVWCDPSDLDSPVLEQYYSSNGRIVMIYHQLELVVANMGPEAAYDGYMSRVDPDARPLTYSDGWSCKHCFELEHQLKALQAQIAAIERRLMAQSSCTHIES
jgi:hypothetical protein